MGLILISHVLAVCFGMPIYASDITDRIIAMGFPAEGFEGLYRNPMEEVKRYK